MSQVNSSVATQAATTEMRATPVISAPTAQTTSRDSVKDQGRVHVGGAFIRF